MGSRFLVRACDTRQSSSCRLLDVKGLVTDRISLVDTVARISVIPRDSNYAQADAPLFAQLSGIRTYGHPSVIPGLNLNYTLHRVFIVADVPYPGINFL